MIWLILLFFGYCQLSIELNSIDFRNLYWHLSSYHNMSYINVENTTLAIVFQFFSPSHYNSMKCSQIHNDAGKKVLPIISMGAPKFDRNECMKSSAESMSTKLN